MLKKRQRVLITGATGMLGHEIFSLFNDNLDYDVYSLSRKHQNANAHHIKADLTRQHEVDVVLREISLKLLFIVLRK